jgi:hypothetical protein
MEDTNMKKTILTTLALVLVAGSAFAANVACNGSWQGTPTDGKVFISDAGGGGDTILTLSPNVKVYYKPATGTAQGTQYAAASHNTKGTKEYGVASDYQGIMQLDIGADLAELEDPSVASAGAFAGDGWAEVGK